MSEADESASKPKISGAVTFDAEESETRLGREYGSTEEHVYRKTEGEEHLKKAQKLIRLGSRALESEEKPAVDAKSIRRLDSNESEGSEGLSGQATRHTGRRPDGLPVAHGASFVDSERFTLIMGAIVCLNVITIGVEADYDSLAPGLFNNVNVAFLLAYFTELCARFLAHGLDALKDRLTNLDVTIFLMNMIGRTVWQEQRGFVSALPAFRLLRVVRFLGESKELKNQKELLSLTQGAYSNMMTLLWMTLLLFLLLVATAKFAYEVVGESAKWNETRDPLQEYEAFEAFDNIEYFGSLSRSLLSLFQVTTLSHWADSIARPIVEVYPATFAFFTCFLFATSYGLVLCIVSNVVIKSMISSKGLEEAKMSIAKHDREKLAEQAWQVFARVDKDGDGFLTASEFAECMEDPLLIELFQKLEAPILEDPQEMVALFDHENSGTVTYFKLVKGLLSFGDPLQSKDWFRCSTRVYSLLMRTKHLEGRLEDMLETVLRARQMIAGCIHGMDQAVDMLAEKRLRNGVFEQMRLGPEAASPIKLTGVEHKRELGSPPAQGPGFMTFAQRFVGFAPSPKSLASATPLASSAASSPKKEKQFASPSHHAWSARGSPLRQAATPGTVVEEPPEPPSPAVVATTVAAVVCGKARLGGPPGRFESERELARQQRDAEEDPYSVIVGSPSARPARLAHLRELLG